VGGVGLRIGQEPDEARGERRVVEFVQCPGGLVADAPFGVGEGLGSARALRRASAARSSFISPKAYAA